MIKRIIVVLSFVVGLPTSWANWPNWLGPDRNGTSPGTNSPIYWSRTEGIAWTAQLPAPAVSPLVIWQDLVFIATRPSTGAQGLLIALDRNSGAQRWKRDLTSVGNSSPISLVTDGSTIAALQSSGELQVFDLKGSELWKKTISISGPSPAPNPAPACCVIHAGKLFVLKTTFGDGQMTGSLLQAFDSQNGKVLWQQDLPNRSSRIGSRSLVPTVQDGQPLLLVAAQDRVLGVKQSDGKMLWQSQAIEFAGLAPVKELCLLGERAVLASSENGSLVVAKLPPNQDPTKLWTTSSTNRLHLLHPLSNSSTIVLYSAPENAVEQFDAQTGQKKWSVKFPAGDWGQTPLIASEKILYCLSREGEVAVLDLETGRFLARTPMATPETPNAGLPGLALSKNLLFISLGSKLHCVQGAPVGTRTSPKVSEVERIGEPANSKRRLPL